MSEGSSGWESDAVASAGMRLTVACMESSAQIAAVELVTASSMRVLCFLAVFGDTISFSSLLNEGAQRLHHGQDMDQDVSTEVTSHGERSQKLCTKCGTLERCPTRTRRPPLTIFRQSVK